MHNPYTTAYKYGFSIFNKTIKKQMPIAQWSHFTFSYIYSSPNRHGAMNQLEITEKERKGIVNRYRGLLRSAKSNLSPEEVKVIRKAFSLVSKFYENKRKGSGEPYIYHLIDVARICVDEIGLGTTAIVCALLHETIELGFLNAIEIEKQFDKTTAEIVENLTKISNLDPKDHKTQSENFRQLIFTLAKDARVILIKLADRLEVMRSLSYEPSDIQLKRSWETFYLYAPLAHRLGLYRLKSEMEDLSMKYTNNEEYKEIIKKLKNTTSRRNRFIREFIPPIEAELEKRGFDFEIKGRTKSIHSIWKKLQQKGVEFEDVMDVFAIRIILNSPPEREKSDCWQVYSIITDWYTPNPERLRDWISVPKSNGYESLHITVVGPEKKWVEVQIRTRRMDEIAEKGLAAHWKYKGCKQEQGIDTWLAQIREFIENNETSHEDFVDTFKLNLYSKEIFVFTPKGDLRKLPAGATVLDFAFDIHSQIGSQCVGGKVNNKNVSIKHTLQNGDVVEIITAKNQKPKNDWLSIVTTSKAKSKIKQSIREEEFKQVMHGRELLLRRLKNWKIADPEESIRLVQKYLKLKSTSELYEMVASGKFDIAQVKTILTQPEKGNIEEKVVEPVKTSQPTHEPVTDDYLVIDERLVNIDFKLSKCCNPIFGDDVFGFVTINEGIKIHRTNCPNAAQLLAKYGYRVVKAKWKESGTSNSFQTTIRITGIDELGLVNRISEVISRDLKVNMRSISFSSSNGVFEGKVQVLIPDTKHLEMVLYKLTRIKGVQKAVRLNQEE